MPKGLLVDGVIEHAASLCMLPRPDHRDLLLMKPRQQLLFTQGRRHFLDQ